MNVGDLNTSGSNLAVANGALPNDALPPIPAKRYFTIGEVSDLCGVKPHVLRYWEQEFTQLRPMKRRGNRRYYQHHEVLLVRRIRELLYEQGFTISGARNRLGEANVLQRGRPSAETKAARSPSATSNAPAVQPQFVAIRDELLEVLELLRDDTA
jgi:DNA-binding transcriptional MerR regulator